MYNMSYVQFYDITDRHGNDLQKVAAFYELLDADMKSRKHINIGIAYSVLNIILRLSGIYAKRVYLL